ncbi:hypothetical protein [Capnocytophaga stomatis]|uniref:hypothetical protein n=1 Tax=Capnocytophaga stomatis TaxID=1848904 RepID=UPI001BB2F283|nr:hypothetical protein [Capnocytophaga stomatis]
MLVTFLEGADPFSGISEHSFHKKEIAFSNEGYLLPLIFLEYLDVKKDRQRFKNFAWNTFNVVLTVSTLGEGTAAMASLRVAAKQGTTAFTRTLATKAIPLADFAYTTGTIAYKSITDTELPKFFGWIEGFFVTKGSYDLLNEGFKTLASLNKIKAIQNTSERSTKLTKLINELNITEANGYIMTDKQLEELIEKNVIRLKETALNDPKVRRAWEEAQMYAEGNAVNYLDELSKNNIPKLESLGWQKTDIELFKNTFKGTFSIENAQSWKLLKDANRTGLMKNADAVEALTRVRNNQQIQKLGFIDELLARVRASRLEDGAFKNILDNLDSFGKELEKYPIEFDNFKNIISKLTDKNPQNSQAAHWILQDITQNAKEFSGKKLSIEFKVINSDKNISYIDVATDDVPPLTIEYKWLTSGIVSKDDFIREFVKRDLFNATDLTKIQWRIKGNKLTKEKVLEYLSSKEAREALEVIGVEKVKSFFPKLSRQINEDNYVDFLINNLTTDEIFNEIFK